MTKAGGSCIFHLISAEECMATWRMKCFAFTESGSESIMMISKETVFHMQSRARQELLTTSAL